MVICHLKSHKNELGLEILNVNNALSVWNR